MYVYRRPIRRKVTVQTFPVSWSHFEYDADARPYYSSKPLDGCSHDSVFDVLDDGSIWCTSCGLRIREGR